MMVSSLLDLDWHGEIASCSLYDLLLVPGVNYEIR